MRSHVRSFARSLQLRVVLQRVSRASVSIEGKIIASVGRGFVVLVAFQSGDGREQVDWMAEKVAGLRVFADDAGKMNRDLAAVDGAVLVVSQFTLYGDATRGRRPSFVNAAQPDAAIPLYDAFVKALRARNVPVETGEFGAMMQVELINDGPVTLILEK